MTHYILTYTASRSPLWWTGDRWTCSFRRARQYPSRALARDIARTILILCRVVGKDEAERIAP